MVMAIGGLGKAVPSRERDTVKVRRAAMGVGNICIPSSLSWMAKADPNGGGIPLSVLEIKMPDGDKIRFPYVTFKSTPHVMYGKPDGSYAYSDIVRCSLVSKEDANDPVFAGLSRSDRNKLKRAVLAA
jgi:hypothetical protein